LPRSLAFGNLRRFPPRQDADVTHPLRPPLARALVAAGIALALAPGDAVLAQAAARAANAPAFALCRSPMPDWYLPDLPREGDREAATTELEADRIGIEERTRYRLEGGVVAIRADQRIAAERMAYDSEAGTFEADGDVRYQDRTITLTAARARGDRGADRTELDEVRYQLIAERGNGTAAQATLVGRERSDLKAVSFSTCDPDDRDWEIVADEMTLDHERGEGRARGMRLRFKDTTLIALPRAGFPIDDRPRSGFLTPSIGASNAGGLDLRLPYYLALAPNYDLTLVPRVVTDRGAMLGAEYRWLTPGRRGQIDLDWMPDDREGDRSRYLWRVREQARLAPGLGFTADLSGISDPRYFEDLGDSLATAATAYLYSSAYFDARGDRWWLRFGGDDIDVTDPAQERANAPYRRLPRLIGGVERDFGGPFRFRIDGEWVDFDRPDSITGRRLDLVPAISAPIERAGWFVRPEVAWRHTSYDLEGTEGPRTPSRSLPIASLDSGLVFDRPIDFFGRGSRQTLEPRLYYLYAPFREQSAIPVFDTEELTFGFAQLFRPTRFSGPDRQDDANQVSLALTSRVLDDADGGERLRASLGRILYFDPQRVQLPGIEATDDSGSAWAGELSFTLDPRWKLGLAQLYDPNIDATMLSSVRVQRRFDAGGIVNVDYRYRRGNFEQIDATTAVPLGERWRLIGRWNWSMDDSRTLEAFAGLEFESCCYAVRTLVRHYVRNAEGDTANAVFIELELKGLGSLGRGTRDFLSQSIRGYR
jgi:LPS-assembly protein